MSVNAWELASWDAVETAERIKRGDVTAREVTDAAIARAEDMRALNAIVTTSFDAARAEADACEAARDRAPTNATSELAGVPFFVKDLFPVAGVRTAWGSGATGSFVPKKSSPEVAELSRARMINLGKSATPEYGLTATTEPLAFGACHNPWAPGHSTGGSSGGAASLVAAGVVPIAHASDGGGSIRIPASCCGLVGLKVTRGRFDMAGSSTLPVNIAVNGCVTRSVRDTIAFWRALESGPSKRTMRPIHDDIDAAANASVRIGYFTSSPVGSVVDDEIIAAVEETAATLRELRYDVQPINFAIPRDVLEDFVALWSYVAYGSAATHRLFTGCPLDKTKLEPLTQGFARKFTSRVLASFREMHRLRSWTQRYEQMLADHNIDVLLLPTLGQLPPRHGHLATDVPFDEALERLYSFCPFTGFFNSSGAPALSLPMARSKKNGVPIGVQLASSRGRDALLLQLGLALEKARPWPHVAPRPATT